MPDNPEIPKRRLQAPHLDEEVRTDELARTFAAGNGASKGRRRGSLMDPRRRHSLPRGIGWAAAGLVVLFVAGFGASYVIARHEIASAVSTREASLKAGVEDLRSFDISSAEKEFSAQNGGPSGWIGTFASLISGGSGAAGAWSDLSGRMLSLTENIGNAENDLWSVLASVPVGNANDASSSAPAGNATTTPLVGDLENIRASLAAIDGDMGKLSDATAELGAFGIAAPQAGGTDYLAFRAEIASAEKFLDAFIPWFADTGTTHHVLVLLENPSEMRPGGGFIGSYADVSVRGGAITGISVHDVADADTAFAGKIVPPVPLMLEGNGWRPADGNWFFDFPTSASETIALFEQSKLYAASSTTFDAAVALTPRAAQDVLALIGPVSVPDAELGIVPAKGAPTSTTFTADGLTEQIQAVVQAGQAQAKGKAGAAPKSVIGILWQSALAELASAGPDEQQQLLNLAFDWVANKDVMAYSKVSDIETFLKAAGVAGDEFRFPQNFNGDYLAVSNTDVNSDKSELYVSSTVAWTVQLGSDGTATDHVAIVRAHHGNKVPAADWWYRTTNQDYLQLFVPDGSTLENESGGFVKKVPAPIDYARNGYSTDPILAAMQSSTAQVFSYPAVAVRNGSVPAGSAAQGADPGKEVFSVWDRTYAASSTQVTFDYSHPLYSIPSDGMQYEFVLERPSGAAGEYKMEIDAPLGYVFAENGLASFVYDSTSTPGRLVVDLTLQKIGGGS